MAKVAALFIDPQGPYPSLVGLGRCWDEARDARTYDSSYPVVAHPPCQLWTNLAAVNWKRYGRQKPAWYPGGEDGGCFASALLNVRRCGGVLEHPAGSHAWAIEHLAHPTSAVGWVKLYRQPGGVGLKEFQGWGCEVWQSAYGHLCAKATWLFYYSDREPFDLRWERKPGTHQIGWFDRKKPTLSKREASLTPQAFAEELVRLAAWSTGK